jgi:Leucine-rich repeat (LRR) protein
LTKLCHLELNGCKISKLNETVSKSTSLQTLLLPYNYELKQLPSSMTKLISLFHLSHIRTKIKSDTMISVVCQLPSSVKIGWNKTTWNIFHKFHKILFIWILNKIQSLQFFNTLSSLTQLEILNLSENQITILPT